jgi:hypothetical protein
VADPLGDITSRLRFTSLPVLDGDRLVGIVFPTACRPARSGSRRRAGTFTFSGHRRARDRPGGSRMRVTEVSPLR